MGQSTQRQAAVALQQSWLPWRCSSHSCPQLKQALKAIFDEREHEGGRVGETGVAERVEREEREGRRERIDRRERGERKGRKGRKGERERARGIDKGRLGGEGGDLDAVRIL